MFSTVTFALSRCSPIYRPFLCSIFSSYCKVDVGFLHQLVSCVSRYRDVGWDNGSSTRISAGCARLQHMVSMLTSPWGWCLWRSSMGPFDNFFLQLVSITFSPLFCLSIWRRLDHCYSMDARGTCQAPALYLDLIAPCKPPGSLSPSNCNRLLRIMDSTPFWRRIRSHEVSTGEARESVTR